VGLEEEVYLCLHLVGEVVEEAEAEVGEAAF